MHHKRHLIKALFIAALLGLVLVSSHTVAEGRSKGSNSDGSNTVQATSSIHPATSGGALGAPGDIDVNSQAERQITFLMVGVVVILGTLLGGGIAWLRGRGKGGHSGLWLTSILFCVLCVLGMIFVWHYVMTNSSDIEPGATIITSKAAADKYLAAQPSVVSPPANDPPVFIPTGVFVQSVEFESANNATVKGYIWQKYGKDVPTYVQKDFILPEAYDMTSTLAYTKQDADSTVMGWNFKASIREQYYYDQYPFDHQTIWLRLWAKDFDRNVFLVPDFAAYTSTSPNDLPGIEHDFVLENWTLNRSYFSYVAKSYNTNFGIDSYTGQQNFAELHFNMDISRSILPTFVGYVIPPAVVSILIFAVLLIITRDPNAMVLLGSTAVSVIVYLASLFFIIILLHINLRNQIQSQNIIYIEYFYFVIYIVVLLVSLNFVFYTTQTKSFILDHRDNLIPKLLYWPCLAGSLFLITLLVFY